MNYVESAARLSTADLERTSAPDAASKLEWMKGRYNLTATEFKILQGLAKGLTPHQIAINNDSAVATVRAHINSIYKKTRVNKLVGLMALMLNGPNTSR
jgi:DNA-binding NarL/FixJ family response regulator